MGSHASQRSLPELPERQSELDVLCVDDDPDYLQCVEAFLARDQRFGVATATDPDTVVGRLDELDCVVGDDEMAGTNGRELLRAIRDRDESFPFLLLTDRADSEHLQPALRDPCSDCLHKSVVNDRAWELPERLHTLVSRARTTQLARRALAAVEGIRDGVAIASPDGDIVFVDRTFERRVGADPDELTGRPWRSLYTDEEVERFERSRLSVVEDGWSWSGDCVVEHADGSTSTVETRVIALQDDSIVLVCPHTG